MLELPARGTIKKPGDIEHIPVGLASIAKDTIGKTNQIASDVPGHALDHVGILEVEVLAIERPLPKAVIPM
jgi:hypothetical protein